MPKAVLVYNKLCLEFMDRGETYNNNPVPLIGHNFPNLIR